MRMEKQFQYGNCDRNDGYVYPNDIRIYGDGTGACITAWRPTMPTTTLPGATPPNPLHQTGAEPFIAFAVLLLLAFGLALFVMWGVARLRGRQLHPRLRSWWALGGVVLFFVVILAAVAPAKGTVSGRAVRCAFAKDLVYQPCVVRFGIK